MAVVSAAFVGEQQLGLSLRGLERPTRGAISPSGSLHWPAALPQSFVDET